MHKRIQVGWIILILMMASLTITACVRPHPDSQVEADETIIVPPVPQEFITPFPTNAPETGSETPEPTGVTEPAPVPIEPTAEPATETTYIVVAGDTLYEIAVRHDVTLEDLAEANDIINVDILEVGQKLIIPAPGSGSTEGTETETEDETETPSEPVASPTSSASETGRVHVVRPGDNLFRIGLQYGCTVEQLARYNGITNPNRISVGIEIKIPDCN